MAVFFRNSLFLCFPSMLLIYYCYYVVSYHRPFLLGTSPFKPMEIPTPQVSSFRLSIFRIMCDVPGICVFCSASIKSFTGIASKFFHKPFVTILVAAVIASIIIHLKFYFHCISIHKLLYFSFFSPAFFSAFLSTVIVTSVIMHVFIFLCLIIIYVLFSVTSLSVCTARFHNTVTSSCLFIDVGVCVCLPFVCRFSA